MNVTLALDDALLAKAKAVATSRDTSVSALVRQALEREVALQTEVDRGGSNGALEVAVGYSIGRIPRAVAIQQLGLADYSELLHFLNALDLPHPMVPIAMREQMAASMRQVLSPARAQ